MDEIILTPKAFDEFLKALEAEPEANERLALAIERSSK